MENFVIVTDSCSDLEKALRDKYDVDYIPMYMISEGKQSYADLDWGEISVKDFYKSMREGVVYKTAQITANDYIARFEEYLKDGKDVLYVACSSALSNSIMESRKAKEELEKKYPERKIICVDSLNACYGLGLLAITASELRKEGKTIEETAKYIEENRLTMHQECTVEKLTYFKNAGRVSATTAFFGGIFNVKPIIISDAKGHNFAIEKVKGRKQSIARVAERMAGAYQAHPYQKVYLSHADCEEDLMLLKEEIEKRVDLSGVDMHIGNIGTIIGATSGPGTVAVFFFGTEVTENK